MIILKQLMKIAGDEISKPIGQLAQMFVENPRPVNITNDELYLRSEM